MELDKNSYQADAVVNLYRAALYLARGSKEIALQLLIKAREKLGDRFDCQLDVLIENSEQYLGHSQDRLYWSEKILDQYHKLKHYKLLGTDF